MKFKAGDKVWAKCSNPEDGLVGIKAAIIYGPDDLRNQLFPLSGPWYELHIIGHDSAGINGLWSGRESNIWPRDEDGRQTGDWRNTAWRPLETPNTRIKEPA